MGKKGDVVIGFRYLMGLHMGVSRGPVDELVSIKVGDRYAFSENEALGVDSIKTSGSLYINQPDLFGGDKKEGGIVGNLDIMMGDWNQPINGSLAAMLGGLVPAFRRMFTLFFDGQICAMNPYPKTWTVRARRTNAGWSGPTFYPEKAAIYLTGAPQPEGFLGSEYIRAMNPAHILYECATNTEWGRGHPESIMNVPSFVDAANTLCAENFGLCMRWVRQSDLDEFVAQVLDHIGGVLYEDRETGKITLDLIRQPAADAVIPVLDETSGLVKVENVDTSSTSTVINEFIVKYHDPIIDADGSVRVQNLGSMQAQHAVYSQTKEYPGLPTADLALRVAQRDLKALGLPLKRFNVTLDRRAWKIRPGSLFILNAPEANASNIRVRAGEIKENSLEDGTVTIVCVQDVFSFPDTSYIETQPSTWTPPDTTPRPATAYDMTEASYRDLVRLMASADLAALHDTSGFISSAVQKPTGMSTNYELWVDSGSGMAKGADANFAPAALLADDIDAYTSVVHYGTSADMTSVSVGMAARLGSGATREIVRVDAIDLSTKRVTIARGCADTLPHPHAAGTPLFFYDSFVGTDRKEYTDGETVTTAYRTKVSGAMLALADAPTNTVTFSSRQARPYPPANMKINGSLVVGLSPVVGDMVFTWAHRDRKTQSDQLVGTTEASVGPETGTTYTIRVYSGATLKHTESGLTGTTWTYTASAMQTDTGVTGAQDLRFEIEALRDSLVSTFKYDFTTHWLPATATGFGLDFGNNFGG